MTGPPLQDELFDTGEMIWIPYRECDEYGDGLSRSIIYSNALSNVCPSPHSVPVLSTSRLLALMSDSGSYSLAAVAPTRRAYLSANWHELHKLSPGGFLPPEELVRLYEVRTYFPENM